MNPLLLKILIGIGIGIVADKLLTPSNKETTDGNLRENGDHGGTSNRTSEQSASNRQNHREHLIPDDSASETVADSSPAKIEPETPTEKDSPDEIPSDRKTIRDVRSDCTSDDFSSEQFADAEKSSGEQN